MKKPAEGNTHTFEMTGRELLQIWKNLEELAIGGFGLCFHGGDAFGDHAGDVVAASRRGIRGARALLRFFKIHSDRDTFPGAEEVRPRLRDEKRSSTRK